MDSVYNLVYKKVFKPIFFLFDPEFMHDSLIYGGSILSKFVFIRHICSWLLSYKNKRLNQKIKNISFPNPVGLSAGFDKNGDLMKILPSIGFGFAQIGTITNLPYGGNTKPRMYRLKKTKSIVVNFGLKNIGADKIVSKLKKAKIENFPLGISIGRTNCKEAGELEKGVQDYSECLKKVIESDIGDLYTINISCPNLYGGEPFTTPEKLKYLLEAIYSYSILKPVFIKMPVHLPWNEFNELCKVATSFNVEGLIIGNLAKDRVKVNIKDNLPDHIQGHLSGMPVQTLSNELISKTYKNYKDTFVIIGVGGIFSAEDAYEKIKRGASLVQLVTGLVFEGPQLIGQINKGLVRLLDKDGFDNISDAVGAYHK